MANEVKLKLAIDGSQAVVTDLNRVAGGLGRLDEQARAASGGADTLKTALAGIATVGTALAVIRMADAVTTLQTGLRLASGSAAEATVAYEKLFTIAQQSRVSFTELGATYATIARATQSLGISQDRLLNVTQAVGNAMTIGGGSAQSMQAALVQLGQGLGSGTLRGEELNSILEQTPRLAKALADGMGVPLGQLRALGEQGKITAESVINALEKSAPQLAKEMASATVTVGQAFTMLSNSALKFVGEADSASGASGNLAAALQSTAGAVDTVGSAINNNQAAFGVIIGGLAGAATLAGVVKLAGGIEALWVAVMAGSAVNPVILGLMALGAAGGAAVAAAGAFKGSVTMMKADAAHLKNSIDAIARDVPQGMDNESVQARAAATLKMQRLTDMRTDLVQKLALMDADTAANKTFNDKESKMLAERTAAQNAAFSGAKSIDEVRKMVKLRTDVLQQGNDEAVALAKSFGTAMAKATPEEAVRLQREMGVRMIASAKETRSALKSFDTQQGADAKEAAKTRLDSAVAGYEQLQTITTAGEKRALDALSAQHGAGLLSDSDYYAQRRDVAANAVTDLQATTELELEAVKKSGLAKKDQAADLAKYTGELEKLKQKQLDVTAQYDAGMIAWDEKVHKLAASSAQAGLKYADDLTKAEVKRIDSLRDAQKAIDDYVTATDDAAAALRFEAGLTGLSTEAHQRAIEQYRIEIDLKNKLHDIDIDPRFDGDLTGARDQARAAVIAAATQRSATAMGRITLDEWRKTTDAIRDGLTDAFMASIDNGKSLFENLRDTVVNMFKAMVLRPIISAVMSPISGAITGSLGLAGSANAAGGSAGGVGGWLNAGSGLKSAYDSVSGGFSAGYNTFATSSVGQGMGLGTQAVAGNNASAYVASTQTGAGSAVGTGLSYVGAGIAGISVGSAIAGDKTLMGVNGTSAAAIGAAIGSYFSPLGTFVGAVIGGVVNAAFGEGEQKHDPTRLTGRFSGEGFSGANKTRWSKEGGWFSSGSSGEDVIGISKAQSDALGLVTKGVQSVFDKLLLTSDKAKKSIVGWTFAIDRQVNSVDQQKQLALDIADSMGNYLIPALAKFKAEGENLADTAVRMTDEFLLTDRAAALMGKDISTAFGAMGLASMGARDELVKMMGGVQTMTGLMQAYYDGYFSNAERLVNDTKTMTVQFDALGLSMPATRQGLRELVDGLDLSTTSGRSAAATLIALSPQFGLIADGMAALAKETATQLMATFTAGGQLVPALAAAQLKVGDFTGGVQVLTGDLSFINKIMGDASSGVISFGAGVVQLDTGLSDSQRSADLLTDQLEALRKRADKARIDFAGLGVALLGVDTTTFVNTIGLVFENLATRISSVIAGISGERVALREAAINIIGPQVMSRASIAAEIDTINTRSARPSRAGLEDAALMGAQASDLEAWASRSRATADAAAMAVTTAQSSVASAKAAIGTTVAGYQAQVAQLYKWANMADIGLNSNAVDGGRYNLASSAYRYDAASNRFGSYDYMSLGVHANRPWFQQSALGAVNSMGGANSTIAGKEQASAEAARVLSNAVTAYNDAMTDVAHSTSVAGAVRTVADAAAKTALLAYTAAQQAYIVEASKSVPRLTKLREETLKYYEAQKQLAGLMTTSAANIRGTISAYNFSQKTDEQKYQDLAGQFSSAYSMSRITTGETLAGYGDKINALLNPMIEALTATGRDGLIASYLAQAESAALSIDAGVTSLGDYQADSLGLLGSIDSVLAELDDGTQAVARAIKAGSDATLNGLAAIVSAITREAAPSTSSWGGPAFASGGAYQGGLALVGERGPEFINFDQPGQVYTAAQTRGMFAGGQGSNTARLEALAERQAQQLEAVLRELTALRHEAAATTTSNEKMAKQGDRLEVIGMPVRNAQGQSFKTEVAA